MARINTYQEDPVKSRGDKVIGSKINGATTKNYSIGGIGDFLNQTGVTNSPGVLSYKFVTINRGLGTMSFETLDGDGTLFSDISSIKIHKQDLTTNDVSSLITALNDNAVVIGKAGDGGKFGIYNVSDASVDSLDSNYYNLTLSFIEGNGSLEKDSFYAVVLDLTSIASLDKHYTHTQSVASATWSINHNLGKFPSATMVLSTGQKGYGDVTYIDNNNLTITFAGAETGKAYIN